MSRILFVMLHPGFVRYYDDAIAGLADAGHDVHVAFEISRTKLGEDETARRLATVSPRITCGTAPTRAESVRAFLARSDRSATRSGGAARSWRDAGVRAEAWESLATTVRLLQDYLRYFDPVFAQATALRKRAEKRLPRVYPPAVRLVARCGATARRLLAWTLTGVESLVRPNPEIEAFIRERRPDLLLVTPLIELGSQQVDFVKGARRLGVRTALCVASWDNLTSKGLMRVVPDHVVVWNEAQRQEAVALHGVRASQVVVTGAQLFDKWFTARPSRSRDAFCRRVGLDPSHPFVLYVGSSVFIAPDEVPFAERWLAAVQGAAGGSLGVLFRPHPANADQWRALDVPGGTGVVVWPPAGTDFTAPDFKGDFFDSIYYSAAVVGINTSAQIEAAILGRPVLTIRAPEFAHSQQGTLHFAHLVGAGEGAVQDSASFDEHVPQVLAAVAGPGLADARNRRFVASFIRPFGIDVPAVPVFVDAVGALAALPAPHPRPESWALRAARTPGLSLALLARMFAEDRPLWVYACRPLLTGAVWGSAAVVATGGVWRERAHPRLKRTSRAARRAWYEWRQSMGRRARRARKPVAALVRGAVRRLAGRNA